MPARPSPRRGPRRLLFATAVALVAVPALPAQASIVFSTGASGAAPADQTLWIAANDGSHKTRLAKGRQSS